MSKIYKIKLPNQNESIETVDMDYVNQKFDSLKNIIRELALTNSGLDSRDLKYGIMMDPNNMKVEPEVKVIDLSREKIKPEDINQDSSHRMLTDAQILLFKNKPTLQEVDDRVSSISEELKIAIEKMFSNVLNLPEALSKLQQIAELFANSPLNTEDGIKRILDDFLKLKEELQEHIESGKHLNNNERKALNLTTDLVNNGMLDKVCAGTVPHSEIADNAKSLNGVTMDNIRGRHLEEVIYGIQPYEESLVDVLFEKSGTSGLDDKFNKTLPSRGVIGFKPGVYDYFNTFNIKSESDLIINGSGCNSTIIVANSVLTNNNQIRDCAFRGDKNNPCKISIYNNTVFNNCTFIHCNIDIIAETNVKFINCSFISTSKFDISKSTGNIIITNNIFDLNSKIPQSVGISNRIIKDNFTSY